MKKWTFFKLCVKYIGQLNGSSKALVFSSKTNTMNTNKRVELRCRELAVFIAATLLAGAVCAQQSSSDAPSLPTPQSSMRKDAGDVPVRPLTAYPGITYKTQRNDNIFLQAPNTHGKDAGDVPIKSLTAYPGITYKTQPNDSSFLQTPLDSVVVKTDPITVVEAAPPIESKPGANVYAAGGSPDQRSTSEATGIPTPKASVPERVGGGGQQAAGGIPMGPLTAYPSVGYEVQHNDNITLQAAGTTVKDTIQVLKPSLRIEGKQGANRYGMDMGVTLGRYSSSAADNYDDNNISANVDLNPTARVRMRLRAEHLDQHDPRGSTVDPLTATPSRNRQGTLGGIFGYGANGAQGRFELELGGVDKHYYSNRVTTAINDRNEKYLGGTFFWRVAPKTSLLAQVKRTNIYFTDATATLDSSEMRYLVGVTWEGTAKTTGIFKVGEIKKDFKNPGVPDSRNVSWDGQVRWSPLSYSAWDFISSKQSRETSGAYGTFVISANHAVRWTHAWTNQFSTIANVTYTVEDYQGVDRHDKIGGVGLRGSYQMRRWLSFGADVNRSKRDSSIDSANYTRNILMLFVNATL